MPDQNKEIAKELTIAAMEKLELRSNSTEANSVKENEFIAAEIAKTYETLFKTVQDGSTENLKILK